MPLTHCGATDIELRHLPGIDQLLKSPALQSAIREHGLPRVKQALRELQAGFRAERRAPDWGGEAAGYAAELARVLPKAGYRTVFNLTGTLIHTNLGRAPLPPKVWEAITPIATRPSNLEFDLDSGRRGHRDTFVAARLAAATGAEAACIVNNNAAALLIVLNTFALGKKVPVSRGELIEIGGSFRLPEIMARAGCELAEVGTTNRTHARDFEAATDGAGMILKVHPSNFHIEGFTKVVDEAELARIAQRAEVPYCIDLGSGTLVDLTRFGLPKEPTPAEAIARGADLVTFSGDKLLGSVQAGLIVGRKRYIDALNANPLKRALRVDKITLAALAATIDLYDDADRLAEHLPVIAAMTASDAELRRRGEAMITTLQPHVSGTLELCSNEAQIGSGALPDQRIPSLCVAISGHADVDALAARLRALPTPVIGRIHKDTLRLDLRGAEPLDELLSVLEALA